MNTQISFTARSAVSEYRVRRDFHRLERAVTGRDLTAKNSLGETLLDTALRLGDRKTADALVRLGDHRTIH